MGFTRIMGHLSERKRREIAQSDGTIHIDTYPTYPESEDVGWAGPPSSHVPHWLGTPEAGLPEAGGDRTHGGVEQVLL